MRTSRSTVPAFPRQSRPQRFGRIVLPMLAALTILFLGIAPPPAMAQDTERLWSDLGPGALTKTSQPTFAAQQSRTLRLDVVSMGQLLQQAPLEGPVHAQQAAIVVSLPFPDGGFGRFRVVESPILAADLAARYPELRTYAGYGLDDPGASARLDMTPSGFHAMILSSAGSMFIDPVQMGDTAHYGSYWKRDALLVDGRAPVETGLRYVDSPTNRQAARLLATGMIASSGPQLRTYRLAMGATGEYTQFHGGTVGGAMAAITTAMNRVNGIYEREVSLRMELVANTDQLVWTNAGTDPYTNNDADAMLTEHQAECDNVIGSANYDVGHIFSTGGGGLAGLGVTCVNGRKAEGVTGSSSPTGDAFWVDFVAHELGHQWGANHTFNGNTGNCSGGNRTASNAYEPGSGSTIAAYAGICGAQNLQPNSDDYFHTASFDQIEAHIVVVGACGTTTATGNSAPVPVAGTGGFAIPISTPFELTGSATDANSDPMTYCWEQFDLGPAGAPGAPVGDAPIFRSFPPVASPTRVFPKLSDLVNNTQTIGELLPSYARNLTFRLTARDNLGGVAHDQMAFTVSAAAGPFLVTAPNTAVTWTGSTTETVTWDVANTDQAPVSAANVDILLSLDGGTTYGSVLVANTANDGSQMILVPNTPTTEARVKVKAAANVFFDISNQDFTIIGGGPACAITDLAAGTQTTCETGTNAYTQEVVVTFENAPGAGTLDVHGQSFAIGTSPQTVVLTALPSDGLPVDVSASFSASPACTRLENALFTAPQFCGACQITDLMAGRLVSCDTGANTYAQEVIVTHLGAPNVGGLNVNGQLFPVTASPQTVVLSGLAVDGQPVNVTATFPDQPACTRTENALFSSPVSCSTAPAQFCMPENPITIPDDDPTGITSNITVTGANQIASVRIFMDIEHNWIGDLIVVVEHNGTSVRLHDETGDSNNDILGWYPTDLTPDGPGTLADFNGLPANGTWTLTVSDNAPSDEGTLWDWCVEVVSSTLATDTGPGDDLPTVATLYPSHPNPARDGITQIRLALPEPTDVGVRIYDVSGRLVRTLHQGPLGRGNHDLLWNGTDQRDNPVASGIYFSIVQGKSTRLTRKIVVVR